jgi:DHA1 family bicyclomycin/chloramphenicol resistance-like MFS transporter
MADPAMARRPPAPGRFAPESLAMTLLLTTLVAFGALSNNIYLPSLPAMARELGVPIAAVLGTLSAFFIGFGVGQLFYGSLSDHFGRRPVLLAGLVGYTIASLVSAFAPDLTTLVAARLAQGLAAAASQVLARAIVRDLLPPDRAARLMSVMAAVFTIVPGLAPILGGILESVFGWRATFMVLTGIGVIVTLTTWRGFAESLKRLDDRALDGVILMRNYAALLRSPVFIGYTFAFSFIFAGMFAFHSASSFIFIDLLGFTPAVYGLFFMVVVIGYFAGSVLSARLTIRAGYARLVLIGGIVAIIGGAAMSTLLAAGQHGWWVIVGPQFVFMVGTGLIMPNSIAGALAPFPEKAGAASALFGFLQQATGAVMVWLIGVSANGTEWPMALGILGGAVLSLAACVLARRGRAR